MGKNGLPDGVTQSDYESYVKDMEGQPPYDPDDATLEDMMREHISAEDALKAQRTVFNKDYIDSVLLDDKNSGSVMRCSLMDIAGAGGVIGNNRGPLFGAKAQAAMSYYVLRRMDDINEIANAQYELGGPSNYEDVCRLGMGSLYEEYRKLDRIINMEQVATTSVISEGVENLLLREAISSGAVSPDSDVRGNAYGGVYYPSNMRQLCGSGPWSENLDMSEYISLAINDKDAKSYGGAYSLAVRDRFCQLVSGAMESLDERDHFFVEVANACDALQSPVAGSLGVVIEKNEPDEVTRALLGYSESGALHDMGFVGYMREREAERAMGVTEPVNSREIKNVPDFEESNGTERSNDYGD